MNVICKKDNLLNYLSVVTKAIPTKSPKPILDCVLISASEIGVVMTCTDLDIGIQTSAIESVVSENGKIAVDAKFFYEIIRRLDGEDVKIILADNMKVNITCGNSNYDILSQDPSEFPDLPSVQKSEKYQMSQLTLKNMLRQTLFSVAMDSSKPVFTGELFELKNNTLNIVSVDGYRISLRSTEMPQFSSDKDVIVMGKNLQELSKILSTKDDDFVDIYTENDHILFDLGMALVTSRLIAGEFIRYNQSFSGDYTTEVTINKNALLQCLDRASLITRDDKKSPVIISIKNNSLEITAKSEMGSALEEMHCNVDGDDMILAFNPKYLKDALRAIDDEDIKIRFIAPLSPCTILPIDGGEYKYLILPLRI